MLTLADFEQTDTYQQIFKKGVALGRAESRSEAQSEGRSQASRDLLITLGTDRFGPPPADVLDRIRSVIDPDPLAKLAVRVLHLADWQSLLAGQ
jgi:hypothetical protein